MPALALGAVAVLASGADADFFAAAFGLAAVAFLVAVAAVALAVLDSGWSACKVHCISSAFSRTSIRLSTVTYRTQQPLYALAGRPYSAGGKNVLPWLTPS